MTREDLRAYLVRAIIVIVASALFLFSIGHALMRRNELDEQQDLREKLDVFMPASKYEVTDLSTYGNHPTIRAFYLARSSSGKLIGFIIDVQIDHAGEQLNTRMSITPDGEEIVYIRPVNEDGTVIEQPDPSILELCDRLHGARIPVALVSQMSVEILTQNEYPSVPGLRDGIFYAEAEDYDRYSYKDFVEIKVSAGRIVSVLWDARHEDENEPNRSDASVSGAFSLGENEPLWAAQAVAVQNKFLEVQDPDKLAMKSDGRTEIIEGVQMDIHAFYELVVQCIENSKRNILKTSATPVPTEGAQDRDDDGTPAPSETIAGEGNSEHPEGDEDNNIYEDLPGGSIDINETITETPTPTPGGEIIGNEDGVVEPGESPVLSDNIDGLPLSEIRTKIEGIPDDPEISVLMTRSVNMAYIFLRDYLKWGA